MTPYVSVVRAPDQAAAAPAAIGLDLASAGDALAHGYCFEELDSLRMPGRAGPLPGRDPPGAWRHIEFDHTGSAGSLE
jgi:hypothetical protein